MTGSGFDHGRRLTDDEYQGRVVALHSGREPMPSADAERELLRQELDLTIDHTLGIGFPPQRRQALWAAHQRVQKHRLRFALVQAALRMLPQGLARGALRMADAASGEYARVLTPAELSSFLRLQPGERPALPVDTEPHDRR